MITTQATPSPMVDFRIHLHRKGENRVLATNLSVNTCLEKN